MVYLHQDKLHPVPTTRSGYRYLFTAKHHGRGNKTDAKWDPALSENDEFASFGNADTHELVDIDGHLYGALWLNGGTELRTLGTCSQEIAKFWLPPEGNPWHGFPSYPLNSSAGTNRRGQKEPSPPKQIIQKMFDLGLIKDRVRRRLLAGAHS